nr:TolC family protein [Planctomycetota bacterium]
QLHLARSNVQANEQFVKEARVTWQKEVAKRGLGASSLPQIAQAREQYERFRQELARSRREFLSAERGLRQILGMPGHTERRLVPDTAPRKDFEGLDWDSSLSEALVNRPEIAAQRESVRTAEISYDTAANGLDPDVTAFANYSLSGVGNNFHDSANTVLDNQFQDWTLGFRYERAFGRRFDQATEQQASVTLLQQRAQLRAVEHSIEHELRAAYDRLVTTSELVDTLENQLAAAQVQIDANQALLENGQISLDLFLRTQAAYAETLRQKEQVFVEYTQALADWEFAKGTIMRTADVTLSEPQLCEPVWDDEY